MRQYIIKYNRDKSKWDKLNDLLEFLILNRIWIVSSIVTEYLEQDGAKMDSLVHLEIKKATVIVECTPLEANEFGIC